MAGRSWADIKDAHQRTHVSTTVALAAAAADEYDRLEEELPAVRQADAQENRDALAPGIARRMEDLAAQLRESQVTFTFRGLGRAAYRRLLLEHPATKDQADAAGEFGVGALEYNVDTFPPQLLKACCVGLMDSGGDVVDVGEIDWSEVWDTWSHGQTQRLWRACVAANTAVADVPKSVAGSGPTAGSRKS